MENSQLLKTKDLSQSVDAYLEQVSLKVGAHGCSGHADDERRERIETSSVASRLGHSFACLVCGLHSGSGNGSEPTAETARLQAHTNEPSKPEHHGNADVLDLLGGERIATVGTEPLHPGVGDSIKEDDKRLDKLGGGMLAHRRPVPRPSQLRERSEEACESNKPIAPENATLCRSDDRISTGT